MKADKWGAQFVVELFAKHRISVEQSVETDSERARIAYSAHTDGGNAKKDLDALNKRRMLQLCDIESPESAMLEASRRVTAAECEAERQRAEADALKAIAVADKLIAVGEKLDDHFAKANEVFE